MSVLYKPSSLWYHIVAAQTKTWRTVCVHLNGSPETEFSIRNQPTSSCPLAPPLIPLRCPPTARLSLPVCVPLSLPSFLLPWTHTSSSPLPHPSSSHLPLSLHSPGKGTALTSDLRLFQVRTGICICHHWASHWSGINWWLKGSSEWISAVWEICWSRKISDAVNGPGSVLSSVSFFRPCSWHCLRVIQPLCSVSFWWHLLFIRGLWNYASKCH